MSCRIAAREDYDLWTIGLLEGPQSEEIASHVHSGCPSCLQALRRCMSMWWLIAAAQAAESTAVPSKALRGRILASVAPKPAPWWFFPTDLRSWFVPAVSAAALVMAVLVWRPSPRPAPVALDTHEKEIASLREELREAQQRADAAVRTPQPPAPVPPIAVPQPSAAPSPNPVLAGELAAARQQATTAADALAAERARATRLQTEIDSLRLLAQNASAQKDEAERKLNAALTDPSHADRDRRLSQLASQVRDLEQQNARYRETILRLERQTSRDLRLVALLNSPSVQLVKLQGSEAGAKSSARAFVVEGRELVFSASNLPPLPRGRTYQLWLLRGRKPAIASGGTFGLEGRVEVSDPNLLTDLRGVAVTEEPAGGSPGPTGHKILVGTLKSM